MGVMPYRVSPLVAVLLTPIPGLADNAADEADLRFRRGVEHYRQRRFEEALVDFFASNRLVKNRNVILNVARCYEQLKQFDEAYRYYNDVRSEHPTAEDLRVVDESLARLLPRVALVQIESEPPGAEIFVDRKDLGSHGQTPKVLALPPGRVKIILTLAGHREGSGMAEPERGSQARVRVPLDFIYGHADLSGAPEGASVRVDRTDGEPEAKLPSRLTLKPGRHIVNVAAPGFVAAQIPTDIAPDGVKSLSVALVPLPPPTGNLVVTANHEGALVKVDGREAGFTPVVLPLRLGKHRVVVSHPDLRSHSEEVTVKLEEQVWVKADLRYDPGKVTAASKTETSVDDAPASITVITREMIDAYGFTSLPDALRGVKGFFATNERTYDVLGLRGFSPPGDLNNRVLVLYDGHAMNDVWAGQAYVGRENDIDLSDVERIEVVRGPVSSLFGSAAFFGVINIVPRRDLGDKTVELVGAAGTLGTSRGKATVAKTIGQTEVLFVGGAFTSAGEALLEIPGLPTPGDVAVLKGLDGERAFSGAARVRHGPLAVFGRLTGRKRDLPTAPFETLVGVPGTAFFDVRGFVEARLNLQSQDSEGFLARGYYDATRFQGNYAYPQPVDWEVDTGGADWVGVELRYRTTEVKRQRLILGAELQRQLRVFQKVVTAEGTSLDQTHQFSVASAFVVDELRISERLLLNGSARYDHYLGSFGPTLNPRLALIARPYASGVTKLMGGRSFRAPSVLERFYEDAGLTSKASPGLGPETILTAELEHNHELSHELRLMGSVFVNQVQSLIHSRVDGSDGLFENVNSEGAVRTFGVEAEVRWQPGRLTQLVGAYWFQRMWTGGFTDPADEARLRANAPRHALSLRAMVPLISSHLVGAVEAIYNSPRLTRGEERQVGELLAVGVGLSGETTGRRFRYYAGVQNLLDERPEVPAGADVKPLTLPGYGRTFLLQASAAY
jgi:outer membrane receptor protein involved in Fe transport